MEFLTTNLVTITEKATHAFVVYSPRMIVALLIILVGMRVAKWISRIISKAAQKASPNQATTVRFIKDVVYYMLLIFVFIAALSQLGIGTASFLAILGTMGLAIGLAFKDSLGNFASGILIIMNHPFEQGDFITIGGESGIVKAVGISNTTIVTPDNKKIIVPNSALTTGNVYNFSANPTRRVDINFTLAYTENIKTAREIIVKMATEDQRILKDPAPYLIATKLSENGVDLSARMWCNTPDYWNTLWDMTEKIKDVIQDAGMSIHAASLVKFSPQVPQNA